jgi:hypothetical protein
VAAVKSTADRLEGELQRTSLEVSPADYEVASQAIGEAREQAARPGLEPEPGRLRWLRRAGRRAAAWWTGSDADQAWAALHTASHALLTIEAPEVVKSRLADLAAMVVTSLSPGDLRVAGYLRTLELLAPAEVKITPADRAQLRAIREACDSAADGGHADARTYRNTLIAFGGLLTVILGAVAVLAAGDAGFRAVFAARPASPGPWYVLQLELVASLAGLASAVFGLRGYTGFQYAFGLPFVQALLKGAAGAAAGLLGVLLVQSSLASALKPQVSGGIFAVAVIFGGGQYLLTRLLDQQARAVLTAAGSRNDPGTVPAVPPGVTSPVLLTTSTT